MSLDTTTTNTSYLFGRLSACFSKIAAFTPEEDWVGRQMPKMIMEPYETMARVHGQIAVTATSILMWKKR